MKSIFIKLVVLATLTTVSLLTGCASVPPVSIRDGDTWRMEVRNDEVVYRGPSLMEGHRFNWTDKAKADYRWVETAMAVGDGFSKGYVVFSAAVIGEGVPLLEKGDVVDVYLDLENWDYNVGKAPVVLRRICSANDAACLAKLRRTQGGLISGVNVTDEYPPVAYPALSAPLKSHHCAFLVFGCTGRLPTPNAIGESQEK